ncbi:hypothetical protein APC1466_0357 [Bifidobacterium longum]|nr:hypothetical protein APC1466_0357 [Bifidobacterium longum]PKD11627.1 hypothetical protein APC1465_0364 [Bifidobacterium longum]
MQTKRRKPPHYKGGTKIRPYQVGVYVTEQNPSKMGWYIHRTSKVTRSTCGNDGSQTYHVEYTMTNTLESSQIGALTSYILGSGGQGVEKNFDGLSLFGVGGSVRW